MCGLHSSFESYGTGARWLSNTKVTRAAADVLARDWAGIDISENAADFVVHRAVDAQTLFHEFVNHIDVPHRTNLGLTLKYNAAENKDTPCGKEREHCVACRVHPKALHLEVDHISAGSKGGTDHIESLRLPCGHCIRIKGHTVFAVEITLAI